ncbi:MAG: hypothetical protein ABW096_06440 [Candidatus Thiodiazotropha sp.]
MEDGPNNLRSYAAAPGALYGIVPITTGIVATDGSSHFETTIGSFPLTEAIHNINCFGSHTSHALCNVDMVLDPIPPLPAIPFQTDIFCIDSTTGESLARVTTSIGENEFLIGFWRRSKVEA